MKKIAKISLLLIVPLMAVATVVFKAQAAAGFGPECPDYSLKDYIDGDNFDFDEAYEDWLNSSYHHTVLLPNPADCSTFYSCSNGVPILMHCPDGLHFNDELDVCDWPQWAGCEDGRPKEPEQPEEPEEPKDPQEPQDPQEPNNPGGGTYYRYTNTSVPQATIEYTNTWDVKTQKYIVTQKVTYRYIPCCTYGGYESCRTYDCTYVDNRDIIIEKYIGGPKA